MTGIALLRGINVGSTRRMGMGPLVQTFEGLGYTRVRTYIQSGNVVFAADQLDDASARIRAGILARFGFEVPVAVRSAPQWHRVVASHPWPEVDPGRIFVGFFDATPPVDRVTRLDPDRSPGDRFQVVGDEVWLDLGTSAHATRLQAAWFEKGTGVPVTFRNWNTVLALAAEAERA